jgi:hypothetical protein
MTKAELTERLAAALAQLWEIPHEHRKLMTAEQVISLGQPDHNIHAAIGGPHVHWNYTWRLTRNHREKTHAVDRPQIAKTDRLEDAHKAFQARVLAKSGQEAPAPVKTKPKVKIRSRGFQKAPEGHKHWGNKR